MSNLPGTPGTSRGGGADVSDVYSGDPRAPPVSETAEEDVFGVIASGDSFVAESPGIAPVAAPAVTNAWTGKRSFSHVVSPKPPVHTSSSSSSHITASEIQRQQSTFIVRRAPPDMSPQGAIKTIAAQMRLPPGALFESALRDPHDRRRLYLVFKTPTLRQEVAAKGFKLGNVTIQPSDGALKGYIPFPPYFVDTSSLIVQLSKHGHVTSSKFITTSDGIRVAGFQFELKLKPSAVPPREIKYGGCSMAVRYSDDLRHCGFCHNYGHTVRFCHKRAAAEEERNLRVAHKSDSAKATEGALPAPADPSTGDDPPGEPDELEKLKSLWSTALSHTINEEVTAIEELNTHYYCRLACVSDRAVELRMDENCPSASSVDVVEAILSKRVMKEWREEWSEIRTRYRDIREADHTTFVDKGMPPNLATDLRTLLPPPAKFPDITISSEQQLEYIEKFGLISEINIAMVDLFQEQDVDMKSDEEEDTDTDDDDDDTDDEDPLQRPMAIGTAQPAHDDNISVNSSDNAATVIATALAPKLPLDYKPIPADEHSRFREQLAPDYDKFHCEHAFRVISKKSKFSLTNVVYNFANQIRQQPNFSSINPASVIVLPFEANLYLIYVRELELANALRQHLDRNRNTLLISKVGQPKINKKFREVVS